VPAGKMQDARADNRNRLACQRVALSVVLSYCRTQTLWTLSLTLWTLGKLCSGQQIIGTTSTTDDVSRTCRRSNPRVQANGKGSREARLGWMDGKVDKSVTTGRLGDWATPTVK
jgi:hypothetical protein